MAAWAECRRIEARQTRWGCKQAEARPLGLQVDAFGRDVTWSSHARRGEGDLRRAWALEIIGTVLFSEAAAFAMFTVVPGWHALWPLNQLARRVAPNQAATTAPHQFLPRLALRVARLASNPSSTTLVATRPTLSP